MLTAVLLIALKTSLLMAAAGIAAALLVRTSAAIRHLVWMSALVLALILPFASLLLPSFAVVPNPWAVPAAVEAAGAAAPADASGFALWQWMLGVWFLGVMLFVLRDVAGHAGLSRWTRRARPLTSPHWTAALEGLDGNRIIRVLESDRVTSPCTWGFVRPVLVLPAEASTWNASQLRYALTHELAHISRGDYVSATLARLACALHWYNPLVWYAARQAHALQERACDDAVLREGGTPSEYAQLLVDIATGDCGALRTAIGMAQRSPLHARVVAILDPRKARAERSRRAAFAAFAPLACLMVFLASASLIEPVIARAVETVQPPPAAPPPAAATAPAAPTPPASVHARHHAPLPPVPPLPAAPKRLQAPAALPPLPALPAVPPVPAVPAVPALPPVPSE